MREYIAFILQTFCSGITGKQGYIRGCEEVLKATGHKNCEDALKASPITNPNTKQLFIGVVYSVENHYLIQILFGA